MIESHTHHTPHTTHDTRGDVVTMRKVSIDRIDDTFPNITSQTSIRLIVHLPGTRNTFVKVYKERDHTLIVSSTLPVWGENSYRRQTLSYVLAFSPRLCDVLLDVEGEASVPRVGKLEYRYSYRFGGKTRVSILLPVSAN